MQFWEEIPLSGNFWEGVIWTMKVSGKKFISTTDREGDEIHVLTTRARRIIIHIMRITHVLFITPHPPLRLCGSLQDMLYVTVHVRPSRDK